MKEAANKKGTMIPPPFSDPALVHRVLLTDPTAIPHLTLEPRISPTPTYEEFQVMLTDWRSTTSSSFAADEAMIMRCAYRDQMVERILQRKSLEDAQKSLSSLHSALRELIPKRTDLHEILDDNAVKDADTLPELLSLVVTAAEALRQLESEVRAESTSQWIQSASDQHYTTLSEESVSCLVTSIVYLLFKADLCDKDKQDFYLSHVWAPKILEQGTELERQAFQARFGLFTEASSAPATRQWIQSLVEKATDRDVLRNSKAARRDLVRAGWIEDILFRSPNVQSLVLPEILALDADRIQCIRQVTRMAAAGSALALHACNAAGQSTNVLNQDPQNHSPSLKLRRAALVQAMGERFKPPDKYETDVAAAVVALAKEWKPSLDESASAMLQSRTQSVLRAKDPVIQLLDSRMKTCFLELVVRQQRQQQTESHVPAQLQTGRRTVDGSATAHHEGFLVEATKLFCSRGLAFYASDLAQSAKMASKVIDLAWNLYDDVLLEKMILEACQS